MEQEIANMKEDLQRLLELEAKVTKHMEKIDFENELNTQQKEDLQRLLELEAK
ncbi:hypothetical protein Csa_007363, partial [Cucumis sativus]